MMSMLDERYASLAKNFAKNRKQIQAALGELEEDVEELDTTLPPAEESILTTMIANLDETDPDIESIREK